VPDVPAFPDPLAAGVPVTTPPLPAAARNVGHGHVFPRPDGRLSRCGGPALCRTCSDDAAKRETAREQADHELTALRALVRNLQDLHGEPWVPRLLAWLTGEAAVLDFDGEEVPPRLRALLDTVNRAWEDFADPLPADPEPGHWRPLRGRCRDLVSDWQANAGSRPLGDPTADAWNTAAAQLLAAVDAR